MDMMKMAMMAFRPTNYFIANIETLYQSIVKFVLNSVQRIFPDTCFHLPTKFNTTLQVK